MSFISSASLRSYFAGILSGVRSSCLSFVTAFPYLFGAGELRKEVTEQYPDPVSSKSAEDLPARSRGFLFNDIERCTGCGDCMKICPTNCISVVAQPGPRVGKEWVAVYDIDFSKCVFCGLCVEICPPGSLSHTRRYEGATFSLNEMVASFGRGMVTPEQQLRWAELRQKSGNDSDRVTAEEDKW